MNVLVYSGTGGTAFSGSVLGTLSALRTLLLPNYTVQSISAQTFRSHPWHTSCALLVFPGGSHPESMDNVNEYISSGGSFLALTSSLSRSARNSRDQGDALRLGSMNLYIGANDVFGRPRLAAIDIPSRYPPIVPNALCHLTTFCSEDVENADGVEVLARDTMSESLEGVPEKSIMGVKYRIGRGTAVVWSLDLEHSWKDKTSEYQAILNEISVEQLHQMEKDRLGLLRDTLVELGLTVPWTGNSSKAAPVPASRPFPQLLVGNPSNTQTVSRVLSALPLPNSEQDKSQEIKDAGDTLHFIPASSPSFVPHIEQARGGTLYTSSEPESWQPKFIFTCRDGELPTVEQTPLFNIERFYRELEVARTNSGVPQGKAAWGMGDAMLYGEVVTSTQTMLDKNPTLFSSLPTPFVSLASYQLTGRGRGTNTWLSPAGCLQFSLLLRTSLAELPASKLVFVQYLFSLAVAQACRAVAKSRGGRWGERVRLKWPNDLYVVVDDGRGGEERKKIGGVLVNTSFSKDKVEIIIGSGTNILTPAPLTSLASLLSPSSDPAEHLTMESALAHILAAFEPMWETFVAGKGSFEPFEDLYLQRWLHSDELVTLTTVSPARKVRIVGLAPDGRLRTVEENAGWSEVGAAGAGFIDLQPDGNSFDIMAGLIKTKT